jgi:glutamyl/glutaminyl-tRNA synthetase
MVWNAEKFREYRRDYYKRNRDRLLAQGKAYYSKHREEILRKRSANRKSRDRCPVCGNTVS